MWHIRTQTLIASPTSSGCIQRSSIRTVIDRELESDGKKLIHDHSWAIVNQLASCSYQVHPPTRHHIRHCSNKSPIKMQTFLMHQKWSRRITRIRNSCEGRLNCSGLNQYRLPPAGVVTVWRRNQWIYSKLQIIFRNKNLRHTTTSSSRDGAD